jgi:Spy/CpxP family protein refolding chaperone
MKPTIRFTLALLAALAIAGCSHSADTSTGAGDNAAQPGSAGAMSQGGAARMHRFARVLKSLNLTPAQEDQIKTIMADARKKNETAPDTQTKRDNMKAAIAQIHEILTPAQRTEFDAKMQAMRSQGQSQGQDQQQQPATTQ